MALIPWGVGVLSPGFPFGSRRGVQEDGRRCGGSGDPEAPTGDNGQRGRGAGLARRASVVDLVGSRGHGSHRVTPAPWLFYTIRQMKRDSGNSDVTDDNEGQFPALWLFLGYP